MNHPHVNRSAVQRITNVIGKGIVGALCAAIGALLLLLVWGSFIGDAWPAEPDLDTGTLTTENASSFGCVIRYGEYSMLISAVMVGGELYSVSSQDADRWKHRDWIKSLRFAALLCPDILEDLVLERKAQRIDLSGRHNWLAPYLARVIQEALLETIRARQTMDDPGAAVNGVTVLRPALLVKRGGTLRITGPVNIGATQ